MQDRGKRARLCTEELLLDDQVMQYVSDYKYLGSWVNEFRNNTKTVDALTATAGR